jgi:phytoene dehydrogenase-like protein
LTIQHSEFDAVIVGSGPNGLAAGVTLAESGRRVRIYEANDTIGGGARTSEVTLPGFKHDICSAIHPMAAASPFYKKLLPKLAQSEHIQSDFKQLESPPFKFIHPPIALAHPFEDGSAALVHRSISDTALTLEKDAQAYSRLMQPLVDRVDDILDDILGPFPLPPKHITSMMIFGLRGLYSAKGLADKWFRGNRARGLIAGLSGHSMLPLERYTSAAIGLVLGMLAHTTGWPIVRTGTQAFTDAISNYFISLGGEICTGQRIASLKELPPTKTILFDVTPKQLLKIAGDYLPNGYRRQLGKFRYGVGVYKIDYALSEPIPWKCEDCRSAGTLHLGGTFEEIANAERMVWKGEHPERPLILMAQQSLFDQTRAPDGKHTAWVYCHVPSYSTVDMTERIEAQIERFAPGFRDIILARKTFNSADMEEYNSNYVGGDINGGVSDLQQLFTRPVPSLNPYVTPAKGIYLCSSSTPPGGGVHGMCGYHAANAVLANKGGSFEG